MAYHSDSHAELCRYLASAVSLDGLARHDWRRQTDVIHQLFTAAAMLLDLSDRAVFVDGHISDHLKRDAIAAIDAGGSLRSFFNRRCHDAGLTMRRLITFDTKTTRRMGRRGSNKGLLHFHSIFEVPQGWTVEKLKLHLVKVFGLAERDIAKMGQRQFHFTRPTPACWDQHYTHNGVQVAGPLGKIIYAVAHGGATYRALQLGEGKRSRRAPPSRGACNRKSTGLARGIPSNFNSEVVLCDRASATAGRVAFDLWVKVEKAKRQPAPKPAPIPADDPHLLPRRAGIVR